MDNPFVALLIMIGLVGASISARYIDDFVRAKLKNRNMKNQEV